MRVFFRGMKWGLAALILIVAVWVASNLIDNSPEPRPTALQLPAPPKDAPMFYALAGLLAPPDSDPVAAGRIKWEQEIARAALPPGTPAAAAERKPTLQRFSGAPLICTSDSDCTGQWFDQPEALSRQLAEHSPIGARCVDALALPRFQELLPSSWTQRGPLPLAPHIRGAVECSLWFAAQAALASTAGDRERTIGLLRQSQQLSHDLLVGSQTLIGNAVAWRLTQRHYQAVAAIASRQPGWAAALQAFAAPLPPEALQPRRWMIAEAAFQHGVFGELAAGCVGAAAQAIPENDWSNRFICWTGLGMLPEATRQELDRMWMATIEQGKDGAVAAVLRSPAPPTDAPSWWQLLRWRNSIGSMLIAVAQPAFDGYLPRQANLELNRQTLALALAAQTQQVPPKARVEWLKSQALPPEIQSRIALSDDGSALIARRWGHDTEGQQPIRVPLAKL